MKRYLPIAAALALCAGCATQHTGLHYYLRGQLDAQKGNLNAAIAQLSLAIARQPHLALAYSSRGDLYKTRGDYHAAARDFASAAKLEPYDFHSHYELALMDQYLKQFTAAIAAYQHALEIRPMSPNANVNLALAYVQSGHPYNAIPYADRARQRKRLSGEMATDLGIIYDQVARLMKKGAQRNRYRDRAIDAFKLGIERRPHDPRLYQNLATEYMHLKQWDQARQVLATAAHLAPTLKVCNRLGLCAFMEQRLAEAARAYRQALVLNPASQTALDGLGVVQMTESLKASPPNVQLAEAALKRWRLSLRINPHQPIIRRLVHKYSRKVGATQ